MAKYRLTKFNYYSNRLINYIFSISDPNLTYKNLDSKGKLALEAHKEYETKGYYTLKASYTDEGTNEAKAITNQANIKLRSNELRSLTLASFDFEKCYVTVGSENAKNRTASTIPLRMQTAERLKVLFQLKAPKSQAFNLPSKYRMADMFRTDLKTARIDYSDDPKSEDYINFHSLRHTTGTLLAASGAHPKVAQSIMRHSDINLTMSRYTHVLSGQENKAIEALPDLLAPSQKARRAEASSEHCR